MEPTTDLIERARAFAVERHRRIGHRRKYTDQPYEAHLANVARRVAEVTDDPEMIAAAWLHDVVEDTEATLADVEREFGRPVARLVSELTDVSRPGDGNRAERKALDRAHLARASARAKTVKLADLIDNCRDICRHDPRFARTYAEEMRALLGVLREGDPGLLREAHRQLQEALDRLERTAAPKPPEPLPRREDPLVRGPHRLRRLFLDEFTAWDLAEPLRSFDMASAASGVRGDLERAGVEVAGLRDGGRVVAYARREDLGEGYCFEYARGLRPDQLIDADRPLTDVVHVLTLHQAAFVSALGEVVGLVRREDFNQPVGRMWLFGIVTFLEMEFTRLVRAHFEGDGWTAKLPAGRVDKARELQAERRRRGQAADLLSCAQFGDKARVLIEHAPTRALLGLGSKKRSHRVLKELESLRNHLAHAQDIVIHDWATIARLAYWVAEGAEGTGAGRAR